jgi:PIN domain nuclease of toxin-antitoxin system
LIEAYSRGPVLLDTQVLVWAMLAPEKLSLIARSICESPDYQLKVSVASLWEVVIKVRNGKWSLHDPVRWFNTSVERLNAAWVPINHHDIQKLDQLPLLHKDPFDRILMAQSQNWEWPLVTADSQIGRYKDVNILW